MFKDLLNILYWWSYLVGIGLIFLPLTRKIFADFFDNGYLFSKVLGVGILSYVVWLLAILKILPFYQETILLVLVLAIIFNLWFKSKSKFIPAKETSNPHQLTIYTFEEIIFLSALIFWSFIRGFQPDIQGLEKFMDFGFVNSILKSKYFPPADMWFAGGSINYYYFGHYVTAFLTKLTGIPSSITYNLMMATLFAFCFSLTFSLTANLLYLSQEKQKMKNLKIAIIGGILSGLLISLGANLHPAYYNFKMKVLKKPYCNGSFFYWYPDATRYIGYCPDVDDKTIHEFPSYSFVVSDLHGHVLDIPFVLLFLALSLNLFWKIKCNENLTFNFSILNILLSLNLAIMFMTNQWDYPIYIMVASLLLLAGLYSYYQNFKKAFLSTISKIFLILLPSSLFFLPYLLNFQPIAKGIGLVWKHSLPHQLLILWGSPWFFGVTFIIILFGRKIRFGFKKESFVKLISRILGVKVEIKNPQQTQSRNDHLIIADLFAISLFIASTILIIIPEIFYIKDIYIPSYHRANTMFKLTYQSFIMFSILTGYIISRLKLYLSTSLLKKFLFTLYYSLFFMQMIYPLYSIPGYYGKLEFKDYKGLYGLSFLQKLYPDDYQAILWLNKNVKGQPVVLEAVGDSYTDYERISMATGFPTIEGWLVHEWLWRGSYDQPGKRASEVQQIYETNDPNTAKNILSKYQVKYVIVGTMEKNKYPNLNEDKFQKIGKVVFHHNTTKIYQID